MAWIGPRNPGAKALERLREEVGREMVAMTEELAADAAKDAPRLPEAEHRARHGEQAHLQDSVSAVVRAEGPERVVGEVTFDAFYAAWVHEDTTDKHPHGGRSKFLGSNLSRLVPGYRERLAAASRRAMRG